VSVPHHVTQVVKAGIDVAAATAILGSIAGLLPPIVTVVSGMLISIYYYIKIRESSTFQKWLNGE
jgi:hypothetical protein